VIQDSQTDRNNQILSQDTSYHGSMPRMWTLESLRTYLDSKIDLLEERTKERFIAAKENINVALSASDRATTKAEDSSNKRFDSVNEFRASLADQSQRLLPRNEYSVQHQNLVEKIDIITNRISEIDKTINGIRAIIEVRTNARKEGISWLTTVLLVGASAASTLVALASFAYNMFHPVILGK
jgi:hypothetical protein